MPGPGHRCPGARPPVDGATVTSVPSRGAAPGHCDRPRDPRPDPGRGTVSTPLDTRPTASDDVRTPARVHRRRGLVLLVLGAFQVWLWVTRLVNLANDPEPRTTAFVAVHAVLYTAAFAAAFVLLGLGWRMWREARRS